MHTVFNCRTENIQLWRLPKIYPLRNKKSKCSNDSHLLLHSHPHITNHHKHLNCFIQLYNTMTAHILGSHNPVTLSEHQSHSNWNQTEEFGSIQHHTKLETRVLIYNNAKHILYKKISAQLSSLNITYAQ